jgi:small subunit ribosomal protein S6
VKTYEAMLLVDPTVATKEWNRVAEEVDRVAKRNGASILQLVKWGERKLAYPIKRNNRGTYVLAYLSAPATAVTRLKSDFQLSEVVLRSMILAHEGELRREPPKDFETAGPLPPKIMGDRPGGGRPWEDRGPRPPPSFEPRG